MLNPRSVAYHLKKYGGLSWDEFVPYVRYIPDDYRVVSPLPVLIGYVEGDKYKITPIPFEINVNEDLVLIKNVERQIKERLQQKNISARLIGGLGNQMFLMATGYALALKMGVPFTFQTHNYEPCPVRYVNEYWNTAFKQIVSGRGIELNGVDEFRCERDKMTYTDFSICGGGAEESEVKNRMQIVGYFQSIRYFDAYKPFIKLLFSSNNEDIVYINQRYYPLHDTGVYKVAVHVRRGDYLLVSHVHHVLPAEYYFNAIQHLTEKHQEKNIKLFVFSDDIEWCKGVFGTDPFLNISDVFYITGERDYIEMQLLRKFDDYILANSTFSWWGAYLNEIHENVHAYMPYKWFEGEEKDTYPHELVGEGWTKISY